MSDWEDRPKKGELFESQKEGFTLDTRSIRGSGDMEINPGFTKIMRVLTPPEIVASDSANDNRRSIGRSLVQPVAWALNLVSLITYGISHVFGELIGGPLVRSDFILARMFGGISLLIAIPLIWVSYYSKISSIKIKGN